MNFRLYYVDSDYVRQLHNVDYRVEYHHGKHDKPYLGIILIINSINYFVPLSSPKPKHEKMNENISFKKISNKHSLLAVLNINNMIPVPTFLCNEINIDEIEDNKYKNLLNQEIFICKKRQNEIKKSAGLIHKFICKEPEKHKAMTKYCCDFSALEDYCNKLIVTKES